MRRMKKIRLAEIPTGTSMLDLKEQAAYAARMAEDYGERKKHRLASVWRTTATRLRQEMLKQAGSTALGNMKAPKFKLPQNKCRKRLSKNIRFDRRSLRWIQSGSAYLLVGCPKGKYDASIDVCLVGTRAYEQVKAAKGGACPRGFKRK